MSPAILDPLDRRSAESSTPKSLSPHAAFAVLDKLHRGVIVTDAWATPLFINAAATTMLLRGDAIFIATGRLTLRSRIAQVALEGYFSQSATRDVVLAETLVLRLDRASGLPAYRLLLMRLQDEPASSSTSEPLFTIFVYEPHAGRFIPIHVLTELYGLSPAEARLTAELFQGHTLEEAGHRLGIALSTARTHLKHVFAKCEVQSQAELLQLLALGPRTC
jgi:DNA-binding CsgD family transcriptional regulator